MIWKAFLKGEEFDLHELGRLFSSGETQVIKDGGEYHLASVAIDSRSAEEPFYDAARRVLTLVNGVGQANNSTFRPVALLGRFQEGDNNHHHVVFAEAAEARAYVYGAAVVTGPDGQVRPSPPPPGATRVGKAFDHSDAAEALQLMGKPEPTTWGDLYKVFEIIRHALKPRSIEASGLATQDELGAFTGSANRPDVAGPDARHARMGGGPPKRTMEIAEARAFIGRVLTAWLDSLR